MRRSTSASYASPLSKPAARGLRRLLAALLLGAVSCGALPVEAQQSDADLGAAAQNPISANYSLPVQNSTFFGTGPNHNKTDNVLGIQPVVPLTFGNWTIISRTIASLIYIPSVAVGPGAASLGEPIIAASNPSLAVPATFGLGDINQTFYVSPATPGDFIWGIGPSINLPTATASQIGSGKLSIGPSVVGLVMPKPWVIGLLARQLFSVAGPSGRTNVNETLIQPLINYNLSDGWYLASSPVITANWSAVSSQRWSVPIGGGGGKIIKIEGRPINVSLQAFDFAEHTSAGPSWALRFQVQFLFPR